MERYYDQKTIQCDGCFFYRPGQYLDGRPYMACGRYAIILSETKPVTDEPCPGFLTPERGRLEQERQQQLMAAKKAARKRK